MSEVTAKSLRKNTSKKHQQPCFICNKHQSITELHHALSLKDCAKYFNLGIVDTISVPMYWLCPNCHAYIHKIFQRGFNMSAYLDMSRTQTEEEKDNLMCILKAKEEVEHKILAIAEASLKETEEKYKAEIEAAHSISNSDLTL